MPSYNSVCLMRPRREQRVAYAVRMLLMLACADENIRRAKFEERFWTNYEERAPEYKNLACIVILLHNEN